MAVRIAGYSCRLPGAGGVEDFWSILEDGRCVVSSIPADRFDSKRYLHPNRDIRGKSVTFAAGVIDHVFDFDSGFFGISPREAMQMDPQQRLLLEVVWEALESAGLPPSSLAGQEVGVFVGASSFDYLYRFILDPDLCDTQMMTGNTLSILANRISYQFDLKGPSLTIDTACSSSLVALSQACQAINEGRIETAIVAGVNLLTAPYPFVGFSIAHMLSANGLCRAFDAAGDGYVRSEGAVALVLTSSKTDTAAGFGDIVGWGTNSDGRTSGLSLPSSTSQAALLRRIYGAFSIDPQDLAFVEAHGTGTRVGDPAEAFAIGETLGRRRGERLPIGSAKTNVGHLEPASGLVGVLKSALSLQKGLLPPSLHFETPNPDIPFDELNIEVAAAPVAFDPGRRPLAGVSSFGFGGSNAHVVLRAPEQRSGRTATSGTPAPLILTARSQTALEGLAHAYRALIEDETTDLGAVANAAAYRRDFLDRRAIVKAEGRQEAVEALEALASGREHPHLVVARASSPSAITLFAFSGNGSQWAGMGRAALATDAGFVRALAEVDAELRPLVGWSARDLLESDIEEKLKEAHFAQPLLFAIQVGVVGALAARGVRPDAVVGHSVGEVAAAWAAGALSLPAAAKVIDARSRSQEFVRGAGAMAALNAPVADVEAAFADGGFPGLEIAAFNAPGSITVSGRQASLDEFLKFARARRWPFRRLTIEYPYHTALLDPTRETLLRDLDGLEARKNAAKFYSSVAGTEAGGPTLDASYWWRNVRQPVLFDGALAAALEAGPTVAIEIGPSPVLGGYMTAIARDAARPLAVLPSLQREDALDRSPIEQVAMRALAAGSRVDKAKFFGKPSDRPLALPHCFWERSTFKLRSSSEAYTDFENRSHTLLGLPARKGEQTYFNHLDAAMHPWIADHKAGGAVVMPAAAIIELALAAAREMLGEGPLDLRDCAIRRPMPLEDGVLYETKTRVNPEERLVDFFSRRRSADGDWVHHARAIFSTLQTPADDATLERRLADEPCSAILSGEEIYDIARSRLLDYGQSFQVIEKLEIFGGDRARIHFSPDARGPAGMLCDPTIIDGGLQGVLALLALRKETDKTFLPTRFDRFIARQPGRAIVSCDVFLKRASAESAVADLVYRAADGSIVAQVLGGRSMAVRLKQAERSIDTYRSVPVLLTPSAVSHAMEDGDPRWRAPDQGAFQPSLLHDASLAILHLGLAGLFGDQAFDPCFPRPTDVWGGVAPARVEPLLARLADHGLARKESGLWKLAPVESDTRPVERLLAVAPERAVEATFLAAAQEHWADLLRGSAAFPDHILDALLLRSRAASDVSEVLRRQARACLKEWPKSRPLRALAVGAIGPNMIRALLDAIDPLRGSVCFVDDDPARLQAIGDAFATAPAFSTATALDAPAGQFDLVLAANPAFCRAAIESGWLADRVADGGGLAIASWESDAFSDIVSLVANRLGPVPSASPPTAKALTADGGFAEVTTQRDGDVALAVTRRVRGQDGDSRTETRGPVRFWPDGTSVADLSKRLAGLMEANEGSPIDADAPDTIVYLGCCDPPTGDVVSWIADRSLDIRAAALSLEGRKGRIAILAPGALRGIAGLSGGRPEAHAVLGFTRVCANEYPNCDLRLIDAVGDLADDKTLQDVAREILAPGPERELLLDSEARVGVRVVVGAAGVSPGPDQADQATWRLEAPAQGSIERVVWTRAERRPPGPDEIEIETRATGLNFRDVMWSLGALPPEALEDGFAGPSLGLECAGTVIRVGANVTGFKPGQPCVAFAPHAFSGHVTIPSHAAAHVPASMPFEAAATIPVSFVTVYYSLVHLARLSEGEIVLVHGGAGGVGLAALQIARLQGARVIATAGSAEKRALLRDLGVDHVFDSRNRGFEDEVLAVTGGRGVDVTLNSLAGEAMDLSIRCLAPFGRFVELGKADFFGDTRIGLRPFSRNLSYFGVDADQLLTRKPELARTLFAEISALLRDGRLKPLPYNVFAGEDVAEALRLMQRSRHVGKIVVQPPRTGIEDRRGASMKLHRDAAYVVVGGLGGFGLALARRLVARGAGRVVLIGRSAPTPSTEQSLEVLRAQGADVVVRSADAAQGDELTMLLDELDADDRPVRGLFHCAMTLDDRLIENLDAASLASVLRTKIAIADRLHSWSASRDLDHFVLFSSATTIVGNPGQANYVAANAYLEELARMRRHAGLPALAVAWGPISDVGYLVGEDQLAKIAARKLARHSISAEAALDSLEQIMASEAGGASTAVIGVGRFEFASLRRELALLSTPAFLRVPSGPDPDSLAGADEGSLARTLSGLPLAEARDRIVGILTVEIARILRAPQDQVDVMKPLSDLGVDSLMGVELRLAAEERLGIDVPLLAIGGSGSITDLAERCLRQLRDAGGATDSAPVAQNGAGSVAESSHASAIIDEPPPT